MFDHGTPSAPEDSVGPGLVTIPIVLVAGGSVAGATQSSATGAWLAFAGALLVALLTWYATDRRQSSALRTSRKQQDAALAAERDRLSVQLEHTQRMDDRQHFREFLDQMAEIYEEALTEYLGSIVAARNDRDWSEHRYAFVNHSREMDVAGRRLSLRLPRDHALCVAYAAATSEMDAGDDCFDDEELSHDELIDTARAHGAEAMERWEAFCEAAREIIGSQHDLAAAADVS